ncbi:MAG TPA: hypothetical protein VK573_02800 [Gemmatimonadales bacterium]|nr:hypothetical protein [Gemmatimonadales bacterium]
MTKERLQEILAQADRTCAELRVLREMLQASAAAPAGQAAIAEAMRIVVRLDDELASYALGILRRNAA